jgi:hypothetical protein
MPGEEFYRLQPITPANPSLSQAAVAGEPDDEGTRGLAPSATARHTLPSSRRRSSRRGNCSTQWKDGEGAVRDLYIPVGSGGRRVIIYGGPKNYMIKLRKPVKTGIT